MVENRYYMAIDIGASSGRHILGHVENGKIELEEVHRFENRQYEKDGYVCWDIENLWNGIIEGLKKCKDIGKIPNTIGIDTWAVDFCLLDENDNLLGNAVAYRDARTNGMDEEVEKYIRKEELYQRTGIQMQPFNTIYQLMSLKLREAGILEKADTFLMIPDYFNFLLTGIKKQEYTNATSTNLVNAYEKTWDYEIIEKLGLKKELFKELSMPGTIVGDLKDDIQKILGFNAKVILPATHDTGSAFLTVPAENDTSVYLSSGTWSLMGVENQSPVTTEESRIDNFTNEGGAWYRYRYLKNIMGLWMIQSVRRELNGAEYISGHKSKYKSDREWSFPMLAEEAAKAEDFKSTVDVNHKSFLAPYSMIDAVKDYCKNHNEKVPDTVGEIMQCVYRSLALCYVETIKSLEKLAGKKYTAINIVGGGCQDKYLNKMIARTTGLPVIAGPVEGTAIGNLLVQMIYAKEFEDLQEARQSILKSFEINKYISEEKL